LVTFLLALASTVNVASMAAIDSRPIVVSERNDGAAMQHYFILLKLLASVKHGLHKQEQGTVRCRQKAGRYGANETWD
jgi:hypothetical protein